MMRKSSVHVPVARRIDQDSRQQTDLGMAQRDGFLDEKQQEENSHDDADSERPIHPEDGSSLFLG